MHLSSLSNTRPPRSSLFATDIIAGQQCGVIESGYRCDGNFRFGNSRNDVRLVGVIAAGVVGIVTRSLLTSATTFLIVRSLGTVLYALVLRRRCPWISLGLKSARPERIRELAAPALGFIALPLGNAISIRRGFTVLIGVLSGPIAVTIFSTLRTLARLNFQLTTVIAWALWPELSAAFGAGDIALARILHRRAYQASLALSLAAGVFLWFIGPLIYRTLIRHAVPFDATTFHILLVVTLANSLWFTSSVVPMSTNSHQRLTIAFTVASALALATGWLLITGLGIRGAAWSLLLIDTLMVSLVLRTSLRQLREKFTEFAPSLFSLPTRRQYTKASEEAQLPA